MGTELFRSWIELIRYEQTYCIVGEYMELPDKFLRFLISLLLLLIYGENVFIRNLLFQKTLF